MKKIRYYYNINTLRYEKQVVPLRVTLFRILAFISAAVVTGLLIVTFAFKFLDSPKEKLLRVQIEKAEELNINWDISKYDPIALEHVWTYPIMQSKNNI